MDKTLTGDASPTVRASLRLVDWPTTGTMDENGRRTSMSHRQGGALPEGTKRPNSGNRYLPR